MVSSKRLAVFSVLLLVAGCAAHIAAPGPAVSPPAQSADAFTMPDGLRLPVREWRPAGEPWAVVLALHGMNDSRDAWEIPGAALADAGILVVAPDQRGFGATDVRGYWPGTDALVDDAATEAALLRAAHPDTKLYVMGESMGAAVAMCLAARSGPPAADGTILIAPAVWGRKELGLVLRSVLWVTYETAPGLTFSRAPGVRIRASDNDDALRRLGRDPLTIHDTRVDAIKGLIDLEDAAVAAAPRLHGPALFLYGGQDQLIPASATVAAWRALPGEGWRAAFYPDGYHLLLRDLEREPRIEDVIAWMHDPAAPLPSGAEARARAWLAGGGKPLTPQLDPVVAVAHAP